MVARLDGIADSIKDLTTETRRANETVAALTNHHHDTDGGIPFTAPG